VLDRSAVESALLLWLKYGFSPEVAMTEADDELVDRQHCTDCGMVSPRTETNFTLISARYGWRLIRQLDAAGRQVLEWRCPRCWESFRGQGKT
jgi:hypothetical protein